MSVTAKIVENVLRPEELRLQVQPQAMGVPVAGEDFDVPAWATPDMGNPRERMLLMMRMAAVVIADGQITKEERKLLKALKQGEINGITWDEQLKDAVDKSIVSKEEADILLHVRELVAEIIAVDDFDVEELRLGRRPESRIDTQHAA